MKYRMMMMVTGVGLLGSLAAAHAQTPAATPPDAGTAPATTTTTTTPPPSRPPQANTSNTPRTIPDVTQPVSPAAPLQPGALPNLSSPDALPSPATPIQTEGELQTPAWIPKIGCALLLGGGYEDFTNTTLKSVTGGGGSWDARLAAGTRQFVGFEVAYVGSARSLETTGLSATSNLISNGFEGNLRVNLPITRGVTLFEPFGFIGVGWSRFSVTNARINTSDLASNDNVLTMPFGGGLEAAYGMLLVDARFTFRDTFGNDLLGAGGGKLNTWGVGGNVGMEF